MTGMGMTARQSDALNAVMAHFAVHGTAPSIATLGSSLGVSKNAAHSLLSGLVERKQLSRLDSGAIALPLTLPQHLAARLAAYCVANGEHIADVLHDAVTLHLDALAWNIFQSPMAVKPDQNS